MLHREYNNHSYTVHMIASLHFGRHFWLDEEDEFCSCPTFAATGAPDKEMWDYVSEWTELEDVDLGKLFYIHRQLVTDAVTEYEQSRC